VELGAFEFTALVISELSNRAQLRAVEAIAERRDTDRLYQTARRMLLLDSRGSVGSLVASLIRETFEIEGVVLFDAHSAAFYESGHPSPEADRQAREAFLADSDAFDSIHKTWFCVLRVAGGQRAHWPSVAPR